MHPIEGAAREMAWTGTVHGLFGELGTGTVTHNVLQMGLALAGLFAGIGATLMLAGGGLVWVGRSEIKPIEEKRELTSKELAGI
jgi:hypothetical protein